MQRGKRCVMSAGPRPTRRPQSAGGRGLRGGLSRTLRSTHTYWGGTEQRAPGPPRASSRSNSVAYRSLSRHLGKNQNHRQQKARPEKTKYFQE